MVGIEKGVARRKGVCFVFFFFFAVTYSSDMLIIKTSVSLIFSRCFSFLGVLVRKLLMFPICPYRYLATNILRALGWKNGVWIP